MSDKILEGLSCCSKVEYFRDCESCPYQTEPICLDALLNDAMDALQGMGELRK